MWSRVLRVAQRVAPLLPESVRRMLRTTLIRGDRLLARLRHKEIVHVLHIPKTGGKALKHALQAATSDRYLIRFWGHSFRLEDAPLGDKVVFFVRDPVSRFLSAYRFRFHEGHPGHPEEWTWQERQLFKDFPTANALAEALFERDAAEAIADLNHFSPLHRWLGRPQDLGLRSADILFVGRQEVFEQDFHALCGTLGVTGDLPTSDEQSNRSPRSSDDYLSPAAIANLKRWYLRDYELLDQLHSLNLISRTPLRE